MSLFGPVDDVDRRAWQARNLQAVTELVRLGMKKKLPPLVWTLPTIGNVTGKVDVFVDDHDPRKTFEAWFAALSKHPGMEPRRLGVRGEWPSRSELTRDGQTRLMAGFTLRPPAGQCAVVILAEWFNEPDDESEG